MNQSEVKTKAKKMKINIFSAGSILFILILNKVSTYNLLGSSKYFDIIPEYSIKLD
jgi:hypothetical protein